MNIITIHNLDSLPQEFVWQDEKGLITKSLGAAAGSGRIYVNIDSLPVGAYSTKYHSHSQQEEFFMILEGTGTLRLNNEYFPVGKGDFISKQGGKNIAHTFQNIGSQPLVILDIGTVDNEDTCYYPDEDIYMQKSNGQRRVFHGSDMDIDWNSNPNE